MTALSSRVRSKRVVRFGLPLIALLATAIALLVPGLGSARTESPQSAGEPTISGSTAVGDTLTGSRRHVGPRAPSATSTTFAAVRRTAARAPGNCEGIIDGSSNQYTLAREDVGFTIRLQVKAFDGGGNKTGVAESEDLERDLGRHRNGGGPIEYRTADDRRDGAGRADADRGRGGLGEQVPGRLLGQLAPLRRRREQLRGARRDGDDLRRRGRGHGLDPALPRDGDEPGRDDRGEIRADRPRPGREVDAATAAGDPRHLRLRRVARPARVRFR